MNILVTGGAGFIASHIADAYIHDGHSVIILDNLSTGKKRNVNPQATWVTGDVRDASMDALFAKSSFDIVNHHAAQIDVRHSIQDPIDDAHVNILGTLRLLECSRTYGVRKFIFASSGGTRYGECPDAAASEESPVQPESPYGLSKVGAEDYIRFYGRTHKLAYTILRYANVFGPRQDPHGEAGVVAIFIGKCLSKSAITIYGTGAQERDYVFVKDVVEANRAALVRGENGIFNVGTGIPTSVNALYQLLATLTHNPSKPTYAPARQGELSRSLLSNALAQKHLGWKPLFTLEAGLRDTIQFFKDSAAKI